MHIAHTFIEHRPTPNYPLCFDLHVKSHVLHPIDHNIRVPLAFRAVVFFAKKLAKLFVLAPQSFQKYFFSCIQTETASQRSTVHRAWPSRQKWLCMPP